MKEFGLSGKERIKSKKEFNLVYTSGSTIYSNSGKLKAHFYYIKKSDLPEVKVGFAVHKKAGIAVWRNRVKRLLRESFRLNKNLLKNFSSEKDLLILVVFSLNSINRKNFRKIYLGDLLPDVIYLLKSIRDKIEKDLNSEQFSHN